MTQNRIRPQHRLCLSHPRHAHFDAIVDGTDTTSSGRARAALHPEAHLASDGLTSFNGAGAIILNERKSGEPEPLRWFNAIVFKLKTGSAALTTISTTPSAATATWPKQGAFTSTSPRASAGSLDSFLHTTPCT